MNELTARDVVLVRAIESADTERAIFNEEDRAYAGRAAAELARWRAAELKQPASAESFVGQRAELLSRTVPKRAPALASAARAFTWPTWIGVALPAAAFALGALIEHIADRQHVNVLAFPLLAIVLWNITVYALLAVNWVSRVTGTRPGISMQGPRVWLTMTRRRALASGAGPAAAASTAFVTQWSERVAPLMAARAARVLHVAAAMFAAGAIAGLYMRGLVFEYRAGWESTFLDATAVHAILSFFLGPATHLLGVAFPTVDEIAAMRFSSAPAAATVNAARWIHLYAVTVSAVVIVPRLILALVARLQEQHRAHAFTFDLSEPYFRRIVSSFSGGVARVRVIPYSFTLDQTVDDGLRAVARALLGNAVEVTVLPPVAFGAEAGVVKALAGPDQPATLTIALFNLAATPENENHGAFLKVLRSSGESLSALRLAVVIDESAYRRRMSIDGRADSVAPPRLAERRDAWRYFCQTIGIDAAFVDLSNPDLAAVERDLGSMLSAPGATPA